MQASHSDLVFSATVANVIKHKPMLLLISQLEFVKNEKADRLRLLNNNWMQYSRPTIFWQSNRNTEPELH